MVRGPMFRRRKCLWISIGALVLLILLAHPTTRNAGYRIIGKGDNPLLGPAYKDLRKWEYSLPQHDLKLPFPEGRTGRYVRFANQVSFLGWNNCLNDRLMNAHLAYMSKRAYVFSDYWWAFEHYQWPPAPKGGASTPMTAIVSGPMVGGPWEAGDDAPRAISERWWHKICPERHRKIIYTDEVKPAIKDASGAEVFRHWQRILEEAPERCLEIGIRPGDPDPFPQVFDLGLWGSERMLSLWDLFKDSPISRLLGPSPIVASAVERNAQLFFPRGPRSPTLASRNPFDRVLAIHLRRGDYEAHCYNFERYSSPYYSWAQLPVLVDKFVVPAGDDPERMEKYLQHCLPTHAQIVKRVGEVRAEYVAQGRRRALDVIYLLTNARGPWLDELRRELRDAGWYTVVTTRDLALDMEQTDVSMAVDMEFARKAAVFVGNGWSSFTSNIIHQRLVDGREPLSIRFT